MSFTKAVFLKTLNGEPTSLSFLTIFKLALNSSTTPVAEIRNDFLASLWNASTPVFGGVTGPWKAAKQCICSGSFCATGASSPALKRVPDALHPAAAPPARAGTWAQSTWATRRVPRHGWTGATKRVSASIERGGASVGADSCTLPPLVRRGFGGTASTCGLQRVGELLIPTALLRLDPTLLDDPRVLLEELLPGPQRRRASTGGATLRRSTGALLVTRLALALALALAICVAIVVPRVKTCLLLNLAPAPSFFLVHRFRRLLCLMSATSAMHLAGLKVLKSAVVAALVSFLIVHLTELGTCRCGPVASDEPVDDKVAVFGESPVAHRLQALRRARVFPCVSVFLVSLPQWVHMAHRLGPNDAIATLSSASLLA
eukprot:scaffold121108_cov28-Tisochrysis_lutea.AAC.4